MRVQTSASNQRTINLRLAEQCVGILRLHTTAIKDAQSIRQRPANQPRHLAADHQMSFSGDRWGCGLSRTDGPDGFVGDDHGTQFGRLDLVDGAADLSAYDLL